MVTRYKPDGTNGPYYNPADSIIAVFPMAVKIAAYSLNSPDNREFLYSLGATKEGLAAALAYYEKYFDNLLECKSKDDPFEAFQDAGLPASDLSFLLFQSWVTASLMSSYHEILVDFGGEMREWRESYISNAKEYIGEHKDGKDASEETN